MSDWALSIDVGTTATAAAIAVGGDHHSIELDGRSRMPSTVLAPPDGPLVVGEAAEAQAALDPERVERTPKRRLGDPVMLLGGRAVDPVDALASIVAHVGSAAAQRMAGIMPARLILTHPAAWGSGRLDLLRDAAARARLPEPTFVSEPVAAAAHLAHGVAAPGDLLAVYDLGGGTFDAAIVRCTPNGFEVAGPPGGDDSLGGEALDDLVARAVRDRLDPSTAQQLDASDDRVWRQARWQLRREARTAKEALSTSASYRWYAGPPIDAELSLTDVELDALIRESIIASVRSLLETIRRAGLAPQQLATVVMVGGCARAPIVGDLLSQAIGRAPTTWGDPKAAVSLGALRAAQDTEVAPADTAFTPPSAPEPAAAPVPDVAPVPSEPDPAPAPDLPPPPVVSTAPAEQPPERAPLAEVAGPARDWDRQQVGTIVAIALVTLGLLFALLAFLVG